MRKYNFVLLFLSVKDVNEKNGKKMYCFCYSFIIISDVDK